MHVGIRWKCFFLIRIKCETWTIFCNINVIEPSMFLLIIFVVTLKWMRWSYVHKVLRCFGDLSQKEDSNISLIKRSIFMVGRLSPLFVRNSKTGYKTCYPMRLQNPQIIFFLSSISLRGQRVWTFSSFLYLNHICLYRTCRLSRFVCFFAFNK